MTDIVERPKPYQIADSLLEMAQDVEIGHADRLGVPAASFLRESADCISRQNDEIERLRAGINEIDRLRGVEQDAVEWVEERTKRRSDRRSALPDLKPVLVVNGIDQSDLLAAGPLTLTLLPNGAVNIEPAK